MNLGKIWRMHAAWMVLAGLVLHLVLIQPNHPGAVSWRAVLLLPLELPAILLALIALGQGRVGIAFRVVLVASLTLIATLKAADIGMFLALNRGFNPVADLPLVLSFYQLLAGAIGQITAVVASVGAVLAVVGVAIALWWACRTWAHVSRPLPLAVCSGVMAIFVSSITVMEIRKVRENGSMPFPVPGTAFTLRVGVERYEMVVDTIEKLRAFREAAAKDPLAHQTGMFDALDRDVFIIFIESYGRTSFDTPFYADQHLETLRMAESRLEQLGLTLTSTFLTAPTQGGQSWLSHGSFANGLWVDNQNGYRAVLGSGRKTLFHLAAESGFHTAAVMPQITLDWPEAESMGFETILAASDLGYVGPAFNWITMPDQFTYLAMDRLLGHIDAPLFVQVATGSSHAPWVPVPTLLDWDDIGDGTIYTPVVEQSDPPSVVWKDYDRVRSQYRASVDYALQAVFAYAELHAEDPALLIIVGDHQAAGFIALDDRPQVPLHVIGPKHLVKRIADEGYTDGLIPMAETEPRPMSDLREQLVQSLTSELITKASQ